MTRKTGIHRKKIYSVLCAALVLPEIAAFYLCLRNLVAPAAAMAVTNAKIVLDAGHGGIDGGVTGKTTGVKESELNLDITYLTAEKFREAGFEVVLTRKTAEGLYGTTAKGFKKRDMLKRRDIIYEARPSAVISIHQNYYPSSFSRGAQAFYLKGSEEGAISPNRCRFRSINFTAAGACRSVRKPRAIFSCFPAANILRRWWNADFFPTRKTKRF